MSGVVDGLVERLEEVEEVVLGFVVGVEDFVTKVENDGEAERERERTEPIVLEREETAGRDCFNILEAILVKGFWILFLFEMSLRARFFLVFIFFFGFLCVTIGLTVFVVLEEMYRPLIREDGERWKGPCGIIF